MPRWPPESAGFSTAGNSIVWAAVRASWRVRTRGELRLRHARLAEAAAHRDLVRHQVRRLGADPGQSERLGDGGDDGDGAVRGHGQDAVDGVAAADLGHGLDVAEVDHLRDIGDLQAARRGIAVDGDHAQAELLRAQDRPPLVAAGTDEEDGGHPRRCYRPTSVRSRWCMACWHGREWSLSSQRPPRSAPVSTRRRIRSATRRTARRERPADANRARVVAGAGLRHRDRAVHPRK